MHVHSLPLIVLSFIGTLFGQEIERNYLRALPPELQHRIYLMALDRLTTRNKERIKKHIKENLSIWEYPEIWRREEHFAFRNFGTVCAHMIVYYTLTQTPRVVTEMPFRLRQVTYGFATVVVHAISKKDESTTLTNYPGGKFFPTKLFMHHRLTPFTPILMEIDMIDKNYGYQYCKLKDAKKKEKGCYFLTSYT